MPRIILNTDEIRRTTARIAHEIIERNADLRNVVIVGLRTRGVPLANRLAASIELFEKIKLPVGELDISSYRDDRHTNGSHVMPVVERKLIPVDINGKSVLLVDDVLYTGRTIRAAMNALIDIGRPHLIQLAVLIDRGHREMPIRPDYVGKNIPSARDEEIQVRLVETDAVDEVAILKDQRHPNPVETNGGLRSPYASRP